MNTLLKNKILEILIGTGKVIAAIVIIMLLGIMFFWHGNGFYR